MMKRVGMQIAALTLLVALSTNAQNAPALQTVRAPDERMKADILVVVAHPDDEGGVTPYLARAIYDEHKRVAVVFATRGGSGGNDFTREHGPALADIREQEARTACAKLGITNVWFLDGKDTASQNVLNSLANWGHGANLEALVRIVRLTRPEVIITWLPGIFIGENHGDHQASGVLATEAFDMANDPTAFPAQVAGATKRLEAYLENLTPWQPKKLYFFSDAEDQKQFDGSGPAYSVKEISPSQKKPYWRLAMDAATPHLTQFPAEIHQMTAMSDEQLNKFMDDPQHSWWTEPMTLIFGQSWVKGTPTGDIFQGILPTVEMNTTINCVGEEFKASPTRAVQLSLGGPWHFYEDFRAKSCMRSPKAKSPEIGVKAGSSLLIPLVIEYAEARTVEVKIEIDAPAGWKITKGEGEFKLPAGGRADMYVEVATPELGKEELKKATTQEIVVHASSEGKTAGEVRLKVLLRASALAQ
jgi:LmbE family N-acetylglucosaminyl deacetylase